MRTHVVVAVLLVAGCAEGPLPDGRYVSGGTFASSGEGTVCAVLIVDDEDVLLVLEQPGEHRVMELRGPVTDEGGCTLTLACDRTKVAGDLSDKEKCGAPEFPIDCAVDPDGAITLDFHVFEMVPFEEDGICPEGHRIDEVY